MLSSLYYPPPCFIISFSRRHKTTHRKGYFAYSTTGRCVSIYAGEWIYSMLPLCKHAAPRSPHVQHNIDLKKSVRYNQCKGEME